LVQEFDHSPCLTETRWSLGKMKPLFQCTQESNQKLCKMSGLCTYCSWYERSSPHLHKKTIHNSLATEYLRNTKQILHSLQEKN